MQDTGIVWSRKGCRQTMNTFTRYLYEYKNGRRVRNAGFVKVEQEGTRCAVKIYGKGFSAGGHPLELFVFCVDEGSCLGFPMGQLRVADRMVGCRLSWSEEDLEEPAYFQKVEGVILRKKGESGTEWYAASWNDPDVRIEEMKLYVPRVMAEEAKEEKTKEEEASAETEESVLTVEEAAETAPPRMARIGRQELAGLPRKEWKLANNQFLLHGLYNYHYLLSFEWENTYWLGVPGIYHPREQKAADIFGFGRFLNPEPEKEEENFGYWCRQVGRLLPAERNGREN